MIGKLYNVVLLTLAINFLCVAGGVAWLWSSGRLGKAQVEKIVEVLFPPPAPGVAVEETQPEDPTTRPAPRLEELLAKASGRTAAEQVQFIQQAFDAQSAQLDRRFRELADLQRQVDLAKQQLAGDRAKFTADQQKLLDEQRAQERLASDKGFQDSLALYQSMPARQVKTLFMGLDDETVVRYLQAMPPRSASKIVKEFKTPEETARVQTILERMRQSQPAPANAEPSQAQQKQPQPGRAGQEGGQANAVGP